MSNDKLRFDFSHTEAMTTVVARVAAIADQVRGNAEVATESAIAAGATAFR